MAWGYNLQLTSVTVKGQPPAAVCIYSSGRESAAVFPSPHSLLLLSNWSLLHSFLYSIKDSFSPLHKHTPTAIPTHALPQMHVDSETEDAPIACIVWGTTAFPCCCQNQMHCSAKSPSRLEWHLEGQKGQVRVSRTGHSPLSKEQFWCQNHFIWSTQALKNLFLWWMWGRERTSQKNPGALFCQGWYRHSLQSRVS